MPSTIALLLDFFEQQAANGTIWQCKGRFPEKMIEHPFPPALALSVPLEYIATLTQNGRGHLAVLRATRVKYDDGSLSAFKLTQAPNVPSLTLAIPHSWVLRVWPVLLPRPAWDKLVTQATQAGLIATAYLDVCPCRLL